MTTYQEKFEALRKRQVIMDRLEITEDGNPVFATVRDEKEAEIVSIRNEAVKAYFEFYKNGKLQEVASYVREDTLEDNNNKVISFVIDLDTVGADLFADYPQVMAFIEKRPTPCQYTFTIGLNMMCFKSYRDNYGTVGSSWEHPEIVLMYSENVYILHEYICETNDIVNGCIQLLKALWGEKCDIEFLTSQEIEDNRAAYEAEMEAEYEAMLRELEEQGDVETLATYSVDIDWFKNEETKAKFIKYINDEAQVRNFGIFHREQYIALIEDEALRKEITEEGRKMGFIGDDLPF